MKATPGPWFYLYGAVHAHGEPTPHTRLLMADRSNPNTSPAERDRNCQLAAAAPDLRDALSDLLECPSSHDARERAREILGQLLEGES